ncbi:MAG: hypothetical protein LBU65_16000 [Planctomycetaceae bacterium]|jgi:hypothetical protein|nr:hypothetical protein [Planctomycetaceae bacterium]
MSDGNIPYEPTSGWIVIGVNDLYDKNEWYDWLKEEKPACMIGYSIWVYHIDKKDFQEGLDR